MVSSRVVLTATTVLGIFGMGWLIMPDVFGRFWEIAPGENLNYMGHRYMGHRHGALLGRNALNTQARRALMIGAFVSLVLTTALSLYGAPALGLNAWSPFAVEFVLAVGLAWVLLIKPEPVV